MNIHIKYCNSIDEGNITIQENCLNIKYGINGTGKTTIAKALECHIRDKTYGTKKLSDLKPFKYRSVKNNNPIVEGLEEFNTIHVFNEDYIEQFLFLPDELMKNSFEVFIRNNEYEKGIEEINSLIQNIEQTFQNNEELDILIGDLRELSGCFGKAKGVAKSSSLYKGFSVGDKINNIPQELEVYRDYIQHEENVKWLAWQMTGETFLEISATSCPYCTSSIEQKKDSILKIKDEYDSNLVKHLNKVLSVIERLNEYFISDSYEKIIDIARNVVGYKKEHESFLLQIRDQIIVLLDKLVKIKGMNFKSLKDCAQIKKEVENYRIDLKYLTHINSEHTYNKVEEINNVLESIIDRASALQGKVNKQKKTIKKTIDLYKTEINDFLRYAGYSYQVDIIDSIEKNYKMILKHNESENNSVDNPILHLSYGERNAFALVLFMFETLKNNSDLIILDDPISSFDKNKKFAITNMLFTGKLSLRGKTVVLLTHDFEPIVDMVYHLPHIFQPKPKSYFLECIDGMLTEKEIRKSDIKTFVEIAKENIKELDEDINKLIYLRRLYELDNNKTVGFQLLSNLFHKRFVPKYIKDEINRNMTNDEIQKATKEIQKYIETFSYESCLNKICDTESMKHLYDEATNNYEKLQIFRLINNENSSNKVIKKFVNETFHLENDYLYQLNPFKYQTIPQYIIDECTNELC